MINNQPTALNNFVESLKTYLIHLVFDGVQDKDLYTLLNSFSTINLNEIQNLNKYLYENIKGEFNDFPDYFIEKYKTVSNRLEFISLVFKQLRFATEIKEDEQKLINMKQLFYPLTHMGEILAGPNKDIDFKQLQRTQSDKEIFSFYLKEALKAQEIQINHESFQFALTIFDRVYNNQSTPQSLNLQVFFDLASITNYKLESVLRSWNCYILPKDRNLNEIIINHLPAIYDCFSSDKRMTSLFKNTLIHMYYEKKINSNYLLRIQLDHLKQTRQNNQFYINVLVILGIATSLLGFLNLIPFLIAMEVLALFGTIGILTASYIFLKPCAFGKHTINRAQSGFYMNFVGLIFFLTVGFSGIAIPYASGLIGIVGLTMAVLANHLNFYSCKNQSEIIAQTHLSLDANQFLKIKELDGLFDAQVNGESVKFLEKPIKSNLK